MNISKLLRLVAYLCYDAWLFVRHSHAIRRPFKNQASAKSVLMREAHALEKGMALPSPLPGFGKKKAYELYDNYALYISRFGRDEAVEIAEDLLIGYSEFQYRLGVGSILTDSQLETLKTARNQEGENGRRACLVQCDRDQLLAALPKDPELFFSSRRSVRQFSSQPISEEEIERAIRMAQRSPSVCNRQAARVYVITEKARIADALLLQNGNRGFGDTGGALFIVTVDLNCFYSNGERHQAFVDGGLFAMTLSYALHSIGLGSCFLNWCVGIGRDRLLKSKFKIPESEVVITFLIAGHLRKHYQCASSPRISLDSVLRWRN